MFFYFHFFSYICNKRASSEQQGPPAFSSKTISISMNNPNTHSVSKDLFSSVKQLQNKCFCWCNRKINHFLLWINTVNSENAVPYSQQLQVLQYIYLQHPTNYMADLWSDHKDAKGTKKMKQHGINKETWHQI